MIEDVAEAVAGRLAGEEPEDGDGGSAREVCWRGRGVVFASLDVDDAELVHVWRADPVAAHEVGMWPRSLSAVRERIERDRDEHDRDDFLVLLPDGTPIGHIALTDQDMVDGTAEIMLMLDPDHRGRGYGVDAVDALVDLAFGELPMQRVQAVTHTTNTAALGVLDRAGFVQEGVRRSACLHRGRRYDVAVLALLRDEWQALIRPRSWDVPVTGQ
ncbi:GNAT family N-acetyltransferase [Streptomyces sp. NBC_01320]|uniref:GNAT family N-acetyltransferase n=1 Tax=Streptomyces sp. NBC_01320 TaxID=2903824 RepID=UPI002E0F0EAD|nr:GNAT family N-acetyltransferase [Streptomyces sp. NBC_01320]WSK00886.1 GNAT family N-acetyltransferase [Streptomyces sp. NBC_01320]